MHLCEVSLAFVQSFTHAHMLFHSHSHALSVLHMVCTVHGYSIRIILCKILQGGGTPIYSVLESLSLFKKKVKGQSPKIADGQKSNCFLAGLYSTSHFTYNTDTVLHKWIISILHITIYSILVHTHPYTIYDISD